MHKQYRRPRFAHVRYRIVSRWNRLLYTLGARSLEDYLWRDMWAFQKYKAHYIWKGGARGEDMSIEDTGREDGR